MAGEISSGPDITTAEQVARRLRIAAALEAVGRTQSAIALIQETDPLLASRLRTRSAQQAKEITRRLRALDPGDRESCEAELRAAQALAQETLAFLAAAGARKTGLDQGITDLAMDWADQVSHDARLPRIAVVLPAVTDFTVMTGSIIKLRVPGDGIWGLPVAMHEYGHFAAAHLTQRMEVGAIMRSTLPAEDMSYQAAESAQAALPYTLGHELFADAFAAAVAGPAYTHYHLRYGPPLSQPGTDSHPSALRRVRTQLGVLKRLARRNEFLRSEIDILQDVKTAALAAAPAVAAVPSAQEPFSARLDQLEEDFIRLVTGDESLRSVVYVNHLPAWRLAEKSLQADCRGTIAQIVNAAWHARFVIERDVSDSREAAARIAEISDKASDLLAHARGATDGKSNYRHEGDGR